LDSFDPKKYWNPNLEIENVVDVTFSLKSTVRYKIVLEKDDPVPYIYEIRRVKGVFYEVFKLHDFPADVQVSC
jgi:hypothetical protein